jgi:hypothetical protein
MIKETNVASAALIKSTVDFFKADMTLIAKRNLLGEALTSDGFKLETDFAAKTAKEAGREDRFRAVQFLAQEGMPAAVKTALRDTSVPGDRQIKADNVTLTKTEWSKRVPGKVRDLKNAFALFSKSEQGSDGDGSGKPQSAAAGFVDLCMKELQASFKRALKDREGEPAAIDHVAFIAHLEAAADVLGKKLKSK